MITAFRRRLLGDGHTYSLIGSPQDVEDQLWRRKHYILLIMLVALAGLAAVFVSGRRSYGIETCDTVAHGFQCGTTISQYWGQYSPYFSVPPEISPDIPEGCTVTFAQILSRHGARDPTASKTEAYNATIQKIQANVRKFSGKYAFLADYEYTLGADQLTTFGQQEMVNSGIKFYERYRDQTRDIVPFMRSSGEDRVVESALNFTQGFTDAKAADSQAKHGSKAYPTVDVIIPEADYGINNTLNHDLCTAFENGTDSSIADDVQETWTNIFAKPIRKRLNSHLPGAHLTLQETIYVMDLCPFNTVASPTGELSPFCNLFTEEEWHQYNYYETLDKWYGYSYGNPLGPTQGVGFANELIARMTDKPVHDETSTNHTLDDDPKTFPLGRQLYADFSHDNDMTAIFAALGLYNGTGQFPKTEVVEARDANGYSAAWTVPFAARAYFEKMTCSGHKGELVRVLINDRVLPLTQCGGDGLGRCTLAKFIESLGFAKAGGDWDKCFL
ncbi:uncharacterized protein LTR77_003683 [Saxophila tyrrhenica]|uniref:Phytase A n=1 Tax=Saxophila tyrrhenica TaxID=1690608 RepID=A0AAV9PH75_9PEZI|nr:hypothetical protein LTR77_003683 [Saxophila tyrrhenica]